MVWGVFLQIQHFLLVKDRCVLACMGAQHDPASSGSPGSHNNSVSSLLGCDKRQKYWPLFDQSIG